MFDRFLNVLKTCLNLLFFCITYALNWVTSTNKWSFFASFTQNTLKLDRAFWFLFAITRRKYEPDYPVCLVESLVLFFWTYFCLFVVFAIWCILWVAKVRPTLVWYYFRTPLFYFVDFVWNCIYSSRIVAKVISNFLAQDLFVPSLFFFILLFFLVLIFSVYAFVLGNQFLLNEMHLLMLSKTKDLLRFKNFNIKESPDYSWKNLFFTEKGHYLFIRILLFNLVLVKLFLKPLIVFLWVMFSFDPDFIMVVFFNTYYRIFQWWPLLCIVVFSYNFWSVRLFFRHERVMPGSGKRLPFPTKEDGFLAHKPMHRTMLTYDSLRFIIKRRLVFFIDDFKYFCSKAKQGWEKFAAIPIINYFLKNLKIFSNKSIKYIIDSLKGFFKR